MLSPARLARDLSPAPVMVCPVMMVYPVSVARFPVILYTVMVCPVTLDTIKAGLMFPRS